MDAPGASREMRVKVADRSRAKPKSACVKKTKKAEKIHDFCAVLRKKAAISARYRRSFFTFLLNSINGCISFRRRAGPSGSRADRRKEPETHNKSIR
jgi:hypothetical protein